MEIYVVKYNHNANPKLRIFSKSKSNYNHSLFYLQIEFSVISEKSEVSTTEDTLIVVGHGGLITIGYEDAGIPLIEKNLFNWTKPEGESGMQTRGRENYNYMEALSNDEDLNDSSLHPLIIGSKDKDDGVFENTFAQHGVTGSSGIPSSAEKILLGPAVPASVKDKFEPKRELVKEPVAPSVTKDR